MTEERYAGKCKGGPYNGQLVAYPKNEMPVLGFLDQGRSTGTYLHVEVDGENDELNLWLWKPLAER